MKNSTWRRWLAVLLIAAMMFALAGAAQADTTAADGDSGEFAGFGDTVEYVGGIVRDEYDVSAMSLDEELAVAYVTLQSAAVEAGKTATWEVTASGGATPYSFYYCLFWQSMDATSNSFAYVSGSMLTTDSNVYTFTIPKEGRYLLQFRITDANGDSLVFQSPIYETLGVELNRKVREIVNSCAGSGKSDYTKALALHDWLCDNASYDYTLTTYDAAGVLLHGSGTCQSFALAYQMLLNAAGVENVYVTGTANGGRHAWNMVKLDGEWYHVDVTWDEDGSDRYYFGMSTALISRDHVIMDRVPEATATKYNYEMNATDGAFASVDELGALLKKLPNGQTEYRFYYTGSDNVGPDYYAWVAENGETYGILTYGQVYGEYTRYVRGTKIAQYFNEDPVTKNAWVEIDGKWYYYENGEALTEQWMKDSTGWCYLGSDGAMTTNAWVMDSKGWCYLGENGYAVTNCWKQDSVGWCYLDSEGSMVKNAWVTTDGKWYFLDENGYRVTNAWRKDSNGWCYLGEDGAMETNAWVMDSKGWCYLGENGYAVTNCWKQDSIGWCYLDGDGSMVKNAWVQTDGKWYFLDENGYRVTNSWRKDSSGWVYVGSDGAMVTNAWTQDSAGWCYMGADGYAVTNCWKHDGTGWRYLGENGSMVKNAWIQLDGQWYYLNADGYMTTGTANIGGVEYIFGEDGALAA